MHPITYHSTLSEWKPRTKPLIPCIHVLISIRKLKNTRLQIKKNSYSAQFNVSYYYF